jgi:hypothetical protein
MRVELHQRKKGFFAFACFSIQRTAAVVNSSSTVSMRFFVSGPVLSILWVPSGLDPRADHAARPEPLP